MQQPTPNRDVRMRGFTQRSLVEEAIAWVDKNALPSAENPPANEQVSLEQCYNRVTATDIHSEINVPSFDRSAMDGYAIQAEETSGAGTFNPLSFKVVGQSMPGEPFTGQIEKGQVVRIMTGAPIPIGADAVIPVEYTTENETGIEITAPIPPAKNIGRTGEDVAVGDCLFATGRQLRPQDVGLLASIGKTDVSVIRQPKVRLLVTGNELARPGEPRSPYQIYESNSYILASLVERDGGQLEPIQFIADERDVLKQAMTAGEPDVILISGGSSVGQEDFAPTILEEEGELAIHGIAMRPSSPTGMGRLGNGIVFLLPGNPVSCLCAYDFFAGRAIRLMGGRPAAWPYAKLSLPLGERKIASAVGRVDYCRVKIDEGRVIPLALSGASILSSTSRADGFVIVSAESEGFGPGTVVDVFCYQNQAN